MRVVVPAEGKAGEKRVALLPDIIEVRPESRELTPFVVARAESGEKPIPAWLDVAPHTMMVIEHLHDLNEFEVFLARLDVA